MKTLRVLITLVLIIVLLILSGCGAFTTNDVQNMPSELTDTVAPVMPSTSIHPNNTQYVNQYGQNIRVERSVENYFLDTKKIDTPLDYFNGYAITTGLDIPVEEELNDNNVTIINGDMAVFEYTNNAYFSIDGGTDVNFSFTVSQPAILEIGYVNDIGEAFSFPMPDVPVKISGANVSIRLEKDGKYKFYVLNLSSEPIFINGQVIVNAH